MTIDVANDAFFELGVDDFRHDEESTDYDKRESANGNANV